MIEYVKVTNTITITLENSAFLLTLFVYLRHGTRFSLIDKASLQTSQDHQLYSCLVSTFAVALGSFYTVPLVYDIIELNMDVIDRRRIFYVSFMVTGFLFMLTLYIAHRIRGCRFSLYARIIMYCSLSGVILNFTQLVLRGYLDINVLYDYRVYSIATIAINIITGCVLLSFPIKYLFNVYVENKSAE
ncbi:hypothetical protein HG263_11955 [Pseudoalteromonas sp. JBTF-M23]|uniref:Uncharacterized protein n=1 Tax=Pseudoalteromonas caenipelagi TaxID=2726988 RepID=A0A849VHN6_9GAMM|nr:hypothetical protein [Pseudoalteromonas caenipelagi]NOU51241.1 hypothetical protein [Pseudoalteromonas caenipelagi]